MYIAPEITVESSQKYCDSRVDIYSFGSSLFFCLNDMTYFRK
jgi:serine/threonine protein kinase